MTDRDAVEEALREPAPDEPSSLPPLPSGGWTTSKVHGATQATAGAARFRVASMLVVILVALALAVTVELGVVSQPTGTPEPSATAGPTAVATPVASDGVIPPGPGFHDGGVSFTFPDTWSLHRIDQSLFPYSSVVAILGNVDLDHCLVAGGFVDDACVWATKLGPGDVLMFFDKTGGAAGVNIFDLAPAGGFKEFIDGMPADMTTRGPPGWPDRDEGREWTVGIPEEIQQWYQFTSVMGGPGSQTLRDEIDSVARSTRFDQPAPTLPSDPGTIATALRRGLDMLDRDNRESQHSRWYACYPRTPDSSATATIEDGPGGPLEGPLAVTCSVTIKPTVIGFWAITLTTRWEAGPGYPGAAYQEIVYVDTSGRRVGNHVVTSPTFPVTQPLVTPAPAKTPIILAPGSLVEVLQPGAFVYTSTDLTDGFNEVHPGDRLLIVDGPRRVGGVSWYRVEEALNSYDGLPGWMPSTFQGHPAVAPVAPRCPAAAVDVTTLVGLHPAERLGCFGDRPITLDPVILADDPHQTSPATGSPAWLADSAVVAMYGVSGPQGVDSPLLVRADPNSIATLPIDTWLEVTGHFDDPASTDCLRSWTEANGAGKFPVEQTPAEQVATCREQFVITAVRPVSVP